MSKNRPLLSLTVAVAFVTATAGALAPTATAAPTTPTDYLVLFKGNQADAAARTAIARAGGTITKENNKIGFAYVRTTAAAAPTTPEPLANLQWDMRQIGATPAGSYAKNQGRRGVRVGIIDTGIDGNHPDIAPNFNRRLSRNFTVDIPLVDGPTCEVPSCIDPNNVDENDHGTHVASTVGSPINRLGIAGVAPRVTLINIRAGQDSGYFFLRATLEAMIYAGDIGVDVINMSYYTDPWLYNCLDNPADSATERAEQRIIRRATQRAINYARARGVLPIAAMGNGATDLGNPTFDDTSPDYPPGSERERDIDNSCITVPTETRGVVSVSSLGPSTRKAYYSDYGTEQTDVSAPGGDFYDSPTNTGNPANLILAAYPRALARERGDLNPDGTPNTPFVVRSCLGATCGYYQYLQGTSMAAPHAAGVAALIVSRRGTPDRGNRGLRLPANATEAWLYRSSIPHACPQPRLFHYTRITAAGAVIETDHYCAGPVRKNGFYGRGIVNAYLAVNGSANQP